LLRPQVRVPLYVAFCALSFEYARHFKPILFNLIHTASVEVSMLGVASLQEGQNGVQQWHSNPRSKQKEAFFIRYTTAPSQVNAAAHI
jgi:hypothetical protein